MQYLAPLPMGMRRSSFVCLIGDSFNTLDAMQAFAQSVHVVVNPSDLPNLTAILKKGLAEFEMAYRVYRISVDSQGDRRAGDQTQLGSLTANRTYRIPGILRHNFTNFSMPSAIFWLRIFPSMLS